MSCSTSALRSITFSIGPIISRSSHSNRLPSITHSHLIHRHSSASASSSSSSRYLSSTSKSNPNPSSRDSTQELYSASLNFLQSATPEELEVIDESEASTLEREGRGEGEDYEERVGKILSNRRPESSLEIESFVSSLPKGSSTDQIQEQRRSRKSQGHLFLFKRAYHSPSQTFADSFNSDPQQVWKASSEMVSRPSLEEMGSSFPQDPEFQSDPMESNLDFLQMDQQLWSQDLKLSDNQSQTSPRLSPSTSQKRRRKDPSRSFSTRTFSSSSPNTSSPLKSFIRSAHTAPSPSSSTNPASSYNQPSLDLSFPSHLKSPTPYQIFHLSKPSNQREIKDRYFDLVRVLHPDRRMSKLLEEGDLSQGSTRWKGKGKESSESRIQDEFKMVISAYELLSDPKRKRSYDLNGIGWNDEFSSSSSSPGSWNGRAPRTETEWKHYHEWSDALRRSSGRGSTKGYGFKGGHDGFGWQQYANNPKDNEAHNKFYGFNYHSNSSQSNTSSSPFSSYSFTSNAPPKPIYTSNTKFFTSVFVLTWTLGYFQYERLSSQSERAVKRADENHLDASSNLDRARLEARSEEGRIRREAWRKRVREKERPEIGMGGEGLKLLEGGSEGRSGYGIGKGGPSGKEAALERERKARERNL